jgi:hypothetical protein
VIVCVVKLGLVDAQIYLAVHEMQANAADVYLIA